MSSSTVVKKGESQRYNPFDKDSDEADASGEGSKTKRQADRKRADLGEFAMGLPSDVLETSGNLEFGLHEDYFVDESAFGLSLVEELELAIDNCKQAVTQSPSNSPMRDDAVKKLVHLRMRLQQAKESETSEETSESRPSQSIVDYRRVLQHQFRLRSSRRANERCDRCTNVVFGLLQAWYTCTRCNYHVHAKCLNLVQRRCAAASLDDIGPAGGYQLTIQPEQGGLLAQGFRCAECRTPISLDNNTGRNEGPAASGQSATEPRQCDYTGLWYCHNCHWGDQATIPARVVHNWDFTRMEVCRASRQTLRLLARRPLLNLQSLNPQLFPHVEDLKEVRRLRQEILLMKNYFLSCQLALQHKLLLQLKDRQHFVDSPDTYSMTDLLDLHADKLLPEVARVHASFAQHIKADCKLCQLKGYICELCDSCEILFPFDNIAISCPDCSTVLHRHCYLRSQSQCPRCERRRVWSLERQRREDDANSERPRTETDTRL